MAVLKPLRFKKTARTFHRRIGEVVQLVNVQMSQGSTYHEKLFYVNVGLAFDPICRLAGKEVLDKPKNYECDSRGTSGRLEEFLRASPACWEVGDPERIEATIAELKSLVQQLALEFEAINSLAAYRSHPWFSRRLPRQENAQILYLLGDFEEAWAEINALCTFFADRQNINHPKYWVEELNLEKFRTRLPPDM